MIKIKILFVNFEFIFDNGYSKSTYLVENRYDIMLILIQEQIDSVKLKVNIKLK